MEKVGEGLEKVGEGLENVGDSLRKLETVGEVGGQDMDDQPSSSIGLEDVWMVTHGSSRGPWMVVCTV